MKQKFRWLFALLAVCMVITMLPVQALAAEQTFTDKYGTWTYEEEDDGSIVIVSFVSARKNIVVPAFIDGKPVRKLGDGLFQDRSDLTMIVVPNGITEIGSYVFSGCEKLERVELPQSLTTIGDGAFSNCENLTDVFIPASVTEFGEDLFIGSPVINVRCGIHSPAAEYLKANSNEVHSFTLIEVTTPEPVRLPVSNGSEAAPSTPDDSDTPSIPEVPEGAKLVTYQFGKTIDGTPEFTVALIDTMPDMDLSQYLTVVNGSEAILDSTAEELLASRFQLVSISRFDGETTADVTPFEKEVGAYIWLDSYPDGDRWIHEVNYSLSPFIYDTDEGSLSLMDFSTDNKLLAYHVWSGGYTGSLVKLSENTYVDYSVGTSLDERHYADGTLVWNDSYQSAYAHRFAVDGICVDVSCNAYTSSQGGGGFNKEVVAEEADAVTRVYLWKTTSDPEVSGGAYATEKGVNVTVESNGTLISDEHRSLCYTADGELVSAHHWQNTPNGDGTYTVVNQNYNKEMSWENEYWSESWNPAAGQNEEYREVTNTVCSDQVEYHEYVVRAENATAAHEEVYGDMFPNEPDEHYSDVTEKNYVKNPNVHTEGTITNLASGETVDYTEDRTETYMESHTYIGNTGKYVGWDWIWSTSVRTDDSDTTQRTNYWVHEYTYESGTDTWTRTDVSIEVKDGSADAVEVFKNGGAVDWNEYEISAQVFVFDPTTESDSDNWKRDDSSDDPELTAQATAIASGSTTVEANGETIAQSKAKEELLEIGESLEETLAADDLEEIFDEAVAQIPDAAEVVEEVEQAMETQIPPESNTDDTVIHQHLPDGSVETEINPELAEDGSEDVSEYVPQAAAEVASETASEVASETVTEDAPEEPPVVTLAEESDPPAAQAEGEAADAE